MKSKNTVLILILVLTIGIVGLTVAYFANSSSVDNVLTTQPYGTTVEETFNSPSNWLPGDETKKEITATNSGEVDEAVRISFTEGWTPNKAGSTLNGWIHADGSKSSHTTESELANDERVAIINFDNDSDWHYENGYYYYKYKIAPGETTSSLIKSVTFNSKTKLDDTCTTTEGNGTKTITCNSSGSDYDHATYTLTFTVETVQYDKYAQAWQLPQNTTIAIGDSKPQAVNFAQYIMSKSNAASITNYTDGVTTEAYTFNHEATAQTPALTDYRYIGASPNNYVEFNCDDNGENCEVWRAIGVFYVDDGNDNWEWRVKLVRGSAFAETMAWDTNNVNEWSTASLNIFLNDDYLMRQNDASNYGLKELAQSQISDAKYYLGGKSYDGNTYYGSTNDIYFWERGTEVYDENNVERSTYWTAKVSLMYPSDYGYTYSKGVKNECFANLGKCGYMESGPWGDGYNNHPETGWIYNSNIISGQLDPNNIWFLSPGPERNDNVFYVVRNGTIRGYENSGQSYGVRPVLYLSSSVKTTSGDGSIDSPYKLSL